MTNRQVCDTHRQSNGLPPAPSIDITEFKCEKICSVYSTCQLIATRKTASQLSIAEAERLLGNRDLDDGC